MRPIALLLILALVPAQEIYGQTVDTDALRKAAQLPSLAAQFGIGFDENGFRIQKVAKHEAIQALVSEMKGNLSDAERHYKLSCLYEDKEKAAESRYEATKLFLLRLLTTPDDGYLLSQLGFVVWDMGQKDEAESLLRKAAAKSPTDWRTWTALGKFLRSCRAYDAMSINKLLDNRLRDIPILFKEAPIEERLSKAQGILAEARACYDRAVAVAPREPGAYLHRAGHSSLALLLLKMFNVSSGKLGDEVDLRSSKPQVFAPETVADLEKVAELDPTNCSAVVGACYFSLLACLQDVAITPEATKSDAEKRLGPIFERARGRLVALTGNKDKRVVGEAAESLGILCTVFAEFDKTLDALPYYRRALEADPGRDFSREILIGRAWEKEEGNEAISLCEKRLMLADSARFRFILASILVGQGNLDRAVKELRAGIRCDATDQCCHIGLAVILVRQGNEIAMMEAADQLTQTAKLFEKPEPERNLLNDWAATFAIVEALQGDVKSATLLLQKVLFQDPKHGVARKALKILGGELPLAPPGQAQLPAVSDALLLPPPNLLPAPLAEEDPSPRIDLPPPFPAPAQKPNPPQVPLLPPPA